jgi:hypothetical protein
MRADLVGLRMGLLTRGWTDHEVEEADDSFIYMIHRPEQSTGTPYSSRTTDMCHLAANRFRLMVKLLNVDQVSLFITAQVIFGKPSV